MAKCRECRRLARVRAPFLTRAAVNGAGRFCDSARRAQCSLNAAAATSSRRARSRAAGGQNARASIERRTADARITAAHPALPALGIDPAQGRGYQPALAERSIARDRVAEPSIERVDADGHVCHPQRSYRQRSTRDRTSPSRDRDPTKGSGARARPARRSLPPGPSRWRARAFATACYDVLIITASPLERIVWSWPA